MTELLIEWECSRCGVSLGEYPRGIELICPVCKKKLVTRGFDNIDQPRKTIKRLKDLKEQSKKNAQRRYRAMRDH